MRATTNLRSVRSGKSSDLADAVCNLQIAVQRQSASIYDYCDLKIACRIYQVRRLGRTETVAVAGCAGDGEQAPVCALSATSACFYF
jgi:hypothetical protein